jgi:hypothetical protein
MKPSNVDRPEPRPRSFLRSTPRRRRTTIRLSALRPDQRLDPELCFSSEPAPASSADRLRRLQSLHLPLTPPRALPRRPPLPFEVRPQMKPGNVDRSPAQRTCHDLHPLRRRRTIDSGPQARPATRPRLCFPASRAPAFQCRIDSAPSVLAAPYTAAGAARRHPSFEVRATDEAGNVDPEAPPSGLLPNDTTGPPQTDVRLRALRPDQRLDPDFSLLSVSRAPLPVPGSTPAAFSPCTPPTLPLRSPSTGPNPSKSAPLMKPATLTRAPPSAPFTIDTAGAATTIDSGPRHDQRLDPELCLLQRAGAGFQCRIDSALCSCQLPLTAAALRDGPTPSKSAPQMKPATLTRAPAALLSR